MLLDHKKLFRLPVGRRAVDRLQGIKIRLGKAFPAVRMECCNIPEARSHEAISWFGR
jgi:hypothetical protein